MLFRSAKVQKQLRFCHKLTKTDYQLRLLTAKEVAFFIGNLSRRYIVGKNAQNPLSYYLHFVDKITGSCKFVDNEEHITHI